MIERLPDMPPGTIGFRVTGEVKREDYDKVLAPELERGIPGGLRQPDANLHPGAT